MKIGFNLLAVGGHIGEEHVPLFAKLKALGYDGVEVPVFEGPVQHFKSLGKILDDHGLMSTIVTIVGEDAFPISADKAVRQRGRDLLRSRVDCAEALGATVMAGPFHSALGVFTGSGPTVSELERLADAMRVTAEYAAQANVKLAIEALNRFECYALNTMAQASALRRAVGHPNFGYMYDTFHANIEERDPVGAYVAHAEEINHIHISENDRGVVGRGHIQFGPVIAAIKASGYDDWLTVEAFGRALPALAAATRVWRDLFPDLDTLFSESIATIKKHLAA